MRFPMLVVLTACAGPLLAAGAPVLAQEGVIPLDTAAVAALARLGPRLARADTIRFRTAFGSSDLAGPHLLPSGLGYRAVVGPAPRLDAGAFALQIRGRAVATGAAVGAGLFGVAAVTVTLVGLDCLDRDSPCTNPVQGGLLVGVLGAAVGALVGAGMGAAIPKWYTVYRYPE